MVHTVPTVVPCVHRVVDSFTLLITELQERGLCAEERDSLPLRIFLSSQGNGPLKAKKPATERTCAQGMPESLNPSKDDPRPPLRSWPAF